MVSKYPELERGQSAAETGRSHIQTRIFKDMTQLRKQRRKLESLLESINPFNAKAKAHEIGEVLDRFIPNVERMHTQLKQYETAFTETAAENAELRRKNEVLAVRLNAERLESNAEQLKMDELREECRQARLVLDRIPREVLEEYRPRIKRNPQGILKAGDLMARRKKTCKQLPLSGSCDRNHCPVSVAGYPDLL